MPRPALRPSRPHRRSSWQGCHCPTILVLQPPPQGCQCPTLFAPHPCLQEAIMAIGIDSQPSEATLKSILEIKGVLESVVFQESS